MNHRFRSIVVSYRRIDRGNRTGKVTCVDDVLIEKILCLDSTVGYRIFGDTNEITDITDVESRTNKPVRDFKKGRRGTRSV